LILLFSLALRGNPSLSAIARFCSLAHDFLRFRTIDGGGSPGDVRYLTAGLSPTDKTVREAKLAHHAAIAQQGAASAVVSADQHRQQHDV
jgi:hypothetical protein